MDPLHDQRRTYEAHVRFLRQAADRLLFLGLPAEAVARSVHAGRNALKAIARRDLEVEVLARIEARNLAKYGDPLGPSADDLFARYGDWERVIDAACRPGGGDLIGSL